MKQLTANLGFFIYEELEKIINEVLNNEEILNFLVEEELEELINEYSKDEERKD